MFYSKTKLEIEIENHFEALNQYKKVCVCDNPITLLLLSSFDKISKIKIKVQILVLCNDLILTWSSLQYLVPEASYCALAWECKSWANSKRVSL